MMMNVRTMHQPGKLENIKQEAARLKVYILRLADARWLDFRKVISDDYTHMYVGHKHGVGLLPNIW